MPKVRGFDRDSQNLMVLNKVCDFGDMTKKCRVQIIGKLKEKRDLEKYL